ncbi:hypothetical protein EQ875_01631 [Photobacterium damselae subsp. damselae]|uniref:hypothetical protein n=1 Tax=Photobacterium damselae TaxID=38293 RepID=UPI00109BB6CB|nr:hypothetical protein [Photobacterium damselae]TGZ35350.1 hypothetical protein EQ875_01631 [Photobacterium damselae subsp. damselae]
MDKCNQDLRSTLYEVLGGRNNVAKFFNVSPQAVSLWKEKGVPEKIALLSHLSVKIPYTYNPSDFDRDGKSLGLNIKQKKVTTNDPVDRVSEQNIKHYRRAS